MGDVSPTILQSYTMRLNRKHPATFSCKVQDKHFRAFLHAVCFEANSEIKFFCFIWFFLLASKLSFHIPHLMTQPVAKTTLIYPFNERPAPKVALITHPDSCSSSESTHEISYPSSLQSLRGRQLVYSEVPTEFLHLNWWWHARGKKRTIKEEV